MKPKFSIPVVALCWMLTALPALAGNVDFGININIGTPVQGPVMVSEPPLFLAPARLGFQVAVGVPYDLCIVDGRYYLFQANVWYVGSGYNGPWQVVHHDHLPRNLRRRKVREIRSYRDREYVIYKRDRNHYQGRSYRPEWHDRDFDRDRDRDGHRHRRMGHDREHYRDRERDRYRHRLADYGRNGRYRADDDRGRDQVENWHRRSDKRAERKPGHDRGHGKGHGNGKNKWF